MGGRERETAAPTLPKPRTRSLPRDGHRLLVDRMVKVLRISEKEGWAIQCELDQDLLAHLVGQELNDTLIDNQLMETLRQVGSKAA